MTPTRALIEAAVRHLSNCRCGGTGLYSRNPYLVEPFDCDKCSELRAAISSAKAAEEGVSANTQFGPSNEVKACRNCGKPIQCLRYGMAYQWTHMDLSGRECCTKYAEPVISVREKEGLHGQ